MSDAHIIGFIGVGTALIFLLMFVIFAYEEYQIYHKGVSYCEKRNLKFRYGDPSYCYNQSSAYPIIYSNEEQRYVKVAR